MRNIILPKSHDWVKDESGDLSAEMTLFFCKKCDAVFLHDMIDNSTSLTDGDGACDEKED